MDDLIFGQWNAAFVSEVWIVDIVNLAQQVKW